MARKLRPFASYKGKPLWMADVSCCQPCLLSLLYEGDSDEKQRYIQVVKNSTFYSFLNERLSEPYDLSDEDTKRLFKQEVFHRIFYGSNWAKANELYQIFESEFPILVGLVRNAKWHHHRDLPVRLQTIEADFVINEVAAELASLHADEDFCLITVHDCLITTEEFIDECATQLRLAFKKRLGFEPTVKVKAITDPAVLREANAPKRDLEFDAVEEAWSYVSESFEEPVTNDESADEGRLWVESFLTVEPEPDWEIPGEIARLLDFEKNQLIEQYEKGRIEVAEMEPLF